MPVNEAKYNKIIDELEHAGATLVAVSKLQSVGDIRKLYDMGQRDFGENYVQELLEKQQLLPNDTRWHFIGHLQKNKAKYIAPFVHLIHGVDSIELLQEINKQAKKRNKVINCLLQVHIAQEETKFGMNEQELQHCLETVTKRPEEFSNVYVKGLMGMASFSDDIAKVAGEMKYLKTLFDRNKTMTSENCAMSILSMGMSGDYKIAIQEGSNMVRIGSLLFGDRPTA